MTYKHVGRALHLMPPRHLIARVEIKVEPGKTVYDKLLRPIGSVDDVFGPVRRPFISIRLDTLRTASRLEGLELYIR